MSERADSQQNGPGRVSISDVAGNADITELGARFVPSMGIHGKSSTAIKLPAARRIVTDKSLCRPSSRKPRLGVAAGATSPSSNRTCGFPAYGFPSNAFPCITIGPFFFVVQIDSKKHSGAATSKVARTALCMWQLWVEATR